MSRTARERRFARKVKALIRHADRLRESEVKAVIRLLDEARRDVASIVATTDWQAYRLPEMKAAIERALQKFGDRYGVDLREAQQEFWQIGVDMTDLPLREVGVVAAVPEIDTAMLSILQGYSSDLISGLARDAIKKINQELTLGLMGQKSPFDVMKAVGRNLNDPGVFRSIRSRAETIVRTEAGRVLEAAGQARKEKAAKLIPGLQKQWYYGHSPKMPRTSHMAAHGQVRNVDEPFLVDGEELMYPRDPNGSASNTINCGCTSIPFHPNWDSAVDQVAVNF
jgi:hypothetical protein